MKQLTIWKHFFSTEVTKTDGILFNYSNYLQNQTTLFTGHECNIE